MARRLPNDAEITESVTKILEETALVPHERIKVSVRDGWVTLEGDVDWIYKRDLAEKAIRNLRGVKGVSNLIKVAGS